MDPEIAALRGEVDALDAELVALLARRGEVVRRLFARKAVLGLPRLDAARESALLVDRARLAAAQGVPEDAAAEVFRAVLRMSHAIE